MKMRIFRGEWFAVYAVFCVCAHHARAQGKNMFLDSRNIRNHETVKSGHVFEDASRDEVSKVGNTGLEEFGTVLIPMKEPKNIRSNYALPLEPDAEMLPAHYTGVKPPGVDHMELKYADSDVLDSNAKTTYVDSSQAMASLHGQNQGGGNQYAKSQHAAEGGQFARSGTKMYDFEKGAVGDMQNQKQKGQYLEGGGLRKAHIDEAHEQGHKSDNAGGQRGSNYGVANKQASNEHSAGYHNVYRKDEYKKDADYYDNDHEGGHFKKHDRYNERHIALEGSYKKGGNTDSGLAEAEHGKKGISENTRANQEAKGHNARQGYDEHFKNSQGFAKESGTAHSKKFGFSKEKTN